MVVVAMYFFFVCLVVLWWWFDGYVGLFLNFLVEYGFFFFFNGGLLGQ